ncbi:MAG: T4 family baseplate hub assembly chaperone [Rhodanobacter sp.]
MHTPTPAQLLQVWERGGDPSAAARGLLLLGCSCDDEGSIEELAALPLGRRDALLFELRERLFGAAIDAVATCPQCAAVIEATFRCDDLRLPAPPSSSFEHVAQGTRVPFRLPDSNDLLALEQCADTEAARALLLERCVLDAQSGDEPHEVHGLPRELQAELAQAMAQADPQADLQLAFRCPDCGHAWQPLFDIAGFLWQELHAWALHLLRDVDTLAASYHWAEADILALSPRRRQAYLELCAP